MPPEMFRKRKGRSARRSSSCSPSSIRACRWLPAGVPLDLGGGIPVADRAVEAARHRAGGRGADQERVRHRGCAHDRSRPADRRSRGPRSKLSKRRARHIDRTAALKVIFVGSQPAPGPRPFSAADKTTSSGPAQRLRRHRPRRAGQRASARRPGGTGCSTKCCTLAQGSAYALSLGLPVAGGCQPWGALRAAECAAFGMTGIGAIFRRYAAGEIIDDAEVAQTPCAGRAELPAADRADGQCGADFSLLDRQNVVSAAAVRALAEAARLIHYSERTYAEIIRRQRRARSRRGAGGQHLAGEPCHRPEARGCARSAGLAARPAGRSCSTRRIPGTFRRRRSGCSC